MALIGYASHFSIFQILLLLSSTAAGKDPFIKLTLLHKNPYPLTPSEALSTDKRRLSTHFSRPKLPVNSAASFGSGQYLVSLHIGTPPQRLLLVADTGSDLTWVSCSACRGQHCSSKRATFFYPRHSTTFSPYHCYDPACTLVPHPRKPVPCNHTRLHSTCRYEYSYSDGSITSGFFSHETTTFNTSSGKLVKFRRLSFGCGFSKSGPSISGPSFSGADGVLGLGRGPISFTSELGRTFGLKFSYCLLDYTRSPTPTSYLLIGGPRNGSQPTAKLKYTPLLTNPLSSTFYYIRIQNVRINNVNLRISPSVWAIDESGNGGTIVDSGTTLTYLAKPAYQIIIAAFKRLVKLPMAAVPTLGFDLCLNVSGGLRPSLPRLSFKLGGGSIFSPSPSNYFIDTADGIKCLALQPVSSPTGSSVIGNLMQQGFTFEFDNDRSRLGFSRHGCSVP
ncbi:LOW QUALITY PROTEIN: aspartic proteinase NANA, chloroplast [Primulina eburnea]|uniref:LOW QUALITY PROTEIN: aspartic proteinase NANA, chloroplast n=1 Tax=Primulina eburnea TaxID=1245227 RepID=UPI003C6BFD8C